MKKLILTSFIFTIIIGCSPLKKLTESEISVAGSTWEYTDEDWTYRIEFVENGKIKITHPNESTPENDTWYQSHSEINFEFNDGFSKYSGKMKSLDLIVGLGKSKNGKWKWKMKRIK